MLDLSQFSAISLNQLNAQASLMERDEKKYLLHYRDLANLLEQLRDEFAVLQIAGNSLFSYDNIYMDTPDLHFYHDHNLGKKERVKVRTRHYKESELYFFEFKQKINGHMRKFRYAIDAAKHGVMDAVGYNFIEEVYQSLFDQEIEQFVFPSLATHYQRITLCHKYLPEKITIDFGLGMTDQRAEKSLSCSLNNVVIIESKTNEDTSVGQEIMESHGAITVSSCSKYCLGYNLLGNVRDNQRFAQTLAIVADLMGTGKQLSRRKMTKRISKVL